MRKIRLLIDGALFIIFVFLAVLPAQYLFADKGQHYPQRGQAVANQIILKLEKGRSPDEFLTEVNGHVVGSIPEPNIILINYHNHVKAQKMAESLSRRNGVIFAEPNYLCSVPEVSQNDQIIPDQNNPVYIAGVSPGPYYNQQATNSTHSDSANLLSTGADIIVGVIDNGIDFDHPLFDGLADSTGYDFIDNDEDPSEEVGDLLGHGTFVSGLVKLMAPDCELMPYRVFDENGVGNAYIISLAIYQAIDDSVDVINMSFNTYTASSSIQTAIAAAHQAGITMVASSGNDSCSTICYPASYDGVISVGAIDSLDYKADFSNYGSYLDVVAPGTMIYSALHTNYESDWGYWNGTSFSAPQVTGTCALILELRSSLPGDSVESQIRETAEKDLAWGTVVPQDTLYGYGYDDALQAVICLCRGDADNSGQIDSLDINYLVDYLNNGGPAPTPIFELGDVNCSGTINMLDVSYLINYLDNNGPAPCCQ